MCCPGALEPALSQEDPDTPGNEEEEARKWAQKRKEASARVRPRPLDDD